jgi:hyperosmotically inducible periplasmic protein
MKPVTATWIAVPAIALLTIAAAPAAARAMASPQTVTEKTIDGAEKATDAVVKGVTVAADKTKDGLSKTGEVMTDEWITGRVHARFVDEDLLKGSDISVDTRKHVVTLKGTVTGQAGRTQATKVAKGTEGVHSVVNKLTIGPKLKG